jgi:hypothetical protein
MDCEDYKELIYLSLYGEIDDKEKRDLERHIALCAVCATEMTRAKKLFEILNVKEEPLVESEWLKSARNQLLAHLQTTKKKPSSAFIEWDRIFSIFRLPILRVAYTTAMLAIGVFIGRFECSSPPQTVQPIKTGQMASEYRQSEIPELLKEGKLRNMDLNVLPDQQLQVSFQGTRDYELTGKHTDEYMKDILAYILLNEENDGLRMRTIETLSVQPDSMVKQMLIYSLLNDSNPGVRLKSIRSLRQGKADEQLRNVYMKVLMTDANSAVRIDAMEGLTGFVNLERVRDVITISAENDSNDYVRLLANDALEEKPDKPRLKGTAIEKLR